MYCNILIILLAVLVKPAYFFEFVQLEHNFCTPTNTWVTEPPTSKHV